MVTTEGDIGALASQMEDMITRKVDAIIVVKHRPAPAQEADRRRRRGISRSLGSTQMDVPGVATSVSSNSDQMSSLVTLYLFKRMGYKGNLLVLTYMPQPEVNERTKEFYRLLKRYPASMS